MIMEEISAKTAFTRRSSCRASSIYLLAVSLLFSILIPQTAAHSLHPRQSVTELPLERPDIAGFNFHKTLHTSAKYNIQLHWTVQAPTSAINLGSPDKLRAPANTYLLHAALQLEGLEAPSAKKRPWVALGLGESSMLNTEFVICRQADDGTPGVNATGGKVTIEERFAPKKYAPPVSITPKLPRVTIGETTNQNLIPPIPPGPKLRTPPNNPPSRHPPQQLPPLRIHSHSKPHQRQSCHPGFRILNPNPLGLWWPPNLSLADPQVLLPRPRRPGSKHHHLPNRRNPPRRHQILQQKTGPRYRDDDYLVVFVPIWSILCEVL